jgi:hypothetical protein
LEGGEDISTLDILEIGFHTFIGGYMKIDLVVGCTIERERGQIVAVE